MIYSDKIQNKNYNANQFIKIFIIIKIISQLMIRKN